MMLDNDAVTRSVEELRSLAKNLKSQIDSDSAQCESLKSQIGRNQSLGRWISETQKMVTDFYRPLYHLVQAHLTELEEHSARDWDFFKDGDTFPVATRGMIICDKCKWIYPCDAVRLKVKRLLGEEL